MRIACDFIQWAAIFTAVLGCLTSPVDASASEILRPEKLQQTLTPSPKPDIYQRPNRPKSETESRSRGASTGELGLLGADFELVPELPLTQSSGLSQGNHLFI